MVWHEMTMFGDDPMIQFTFGHSDELCRHVSELYLITSVKPAFIATQLKFWETAPTLFYPPLVEDFKNVTIFPYMPLFGGTFGDISFWSLYFIILDFVKQPH